MRFSIGLVLTVVLGLAISPLHARSLLDLQIVDRDTGAVLTTYADDGQIWVAGIPGHRYAVRLRNLTRQRVLAVVSVDGVNVISGETAGAHQAGYVLAPHGLADIAGWRKNLDEIAQFTFTALPDSYAARTGRPANVGVIGVAVFTERAPRPLPRPREIAREQALPAPAPATGAAPPSARTETADAMRAPAYARQAERLGTGHGEREYDRVEKTRFVRASRNPVETLSIRYDSQQNLVAMGIVPQRPQPHAPQAFPNSFVPDPPAWR